MKIKMMSVKLIVGFTTKLNFAVYSVHKNHVYKINTFLIENTSMEKLFLTSLNTLLPSHFISQ